MSCSQDAPFQPGPCPTCGKPGCGAKKKSGPGYCHQHPGRGTDHPGLGRCKLHGGATPAFVGTTELARYRVGEKLGDLIDQYRADPDPLSVLDELALMRGVLHDALERATEEGGSRLAVCPTCRQPTSLERLSGLADRISRVVARVERARAQDAISRAEFMSFFQKVALAVQWEVDEETLERIRERWKDLTVEAP